MAEEKRVVGNKHIEALAKLMSEGVELYQSAENHDLIAALRDPVCIIRKNWESEKYPSSVLIEEQAGIIRRYFRDAILQRMGGLVNEQKDHKEVWLTTDILARLERINRLLERREIINSVVGCA